MERRRELLQMRLVTGGWRYIGRRVVSQLLDREKRVVVLDRADRTDVVRTAAEMRPDKRHCA